MFYLATYQPRIALIGCRPTPRASAVVKLRKVGFPVSSCWPTTDGRAIVTGPAVRVCGFVGRARAGLQEADRNGWNRIKRSGAYPAAPWANAISVPKCRLKYRGSPGASDTQFGLLCPECGTDLTHVKNPTGARVLIPRVPQLARSPGRMAGASPVTDLADLH